MRGRMIIAATALVLGSSLLAMAQEKAPGGEVSPVLPKAEQQTLESFGVANAGCVEWADGCAVCLRHEDGKVACSLPGIACQPTAITCRRQK